jgi:predicted aspartyl protease
VGKLLSHDRRQALALMGGALALGAPAISRAQGLPASPLASLPEAQFGSHPVDVVMTMDDAWRRLTAPVYVNGQGPFDFVVDTGANRSLISAETAAALGLPTGRKVVLHGINGDEQVDTVRLDSFRIGAREARNVEVATVSDVHLGADGLLGVDGLKDQRLVLDFANKELRIEPSKALAVHAKTSVIRARRRFGQLTVVDTDLLGQKVNVFLDTGSDVTVGNSVLRSRLERRKPAEEGVKSTTLLGATGGSITGDYGNLPVFRLGELQLLNMRLVYADLHPFRLWNLDKQPSLQLGIEIMRFFDRVTLDYGRNEVSFTLPDQAYVDPAGTTWMRPHT